MSDHPIYIFIVEVDKNLAIQCYERGLSDLNTIWPQLLSACTEADNAVSKRASESLKTREKEAREEARKFLGKKVVRQRALPKEKWWHLTQYLEEVEYIGVTEKALDMHMRLYGPRSLPSFFMPTHTLVYTDMLEALDQRLQHVKLSALPTLRMDEGEAKVMRQWGNGSKVAEIKQSLKLYNKEE